MSFLTPKMSIPAPPPPPPAPPPPPIKPVDRAEIDKEERRVKRRRGTQATILTSSAGLTADEDTYTPALLGP